MKNKVLLNKSEKKKRIEEAALALFSCNEVHQISIDQIAQKAKVAKGTFYLYFHDKVQLINHLIVKESSSIIRRCHRHAQSERFRVVGDQSGGLRRILRLDAQGLRIGLRRGGHLARCVIGRI